MSGQSSDIDAAEQRWNALYLSGDADGFADLLDDDFLYVSERGVFDKAAYVGNLRKGEIEMRALETVSSRQRAFGTTVIVTGEVSMEASFQGQDISGVDLYTRVWRLDGDRTVALSQHACAKPSTGP